MAINYTRLFEIEEGQRFVLVRTGRKYTKGKRKEKRHEYICEPDNRRTKYEGHLNWACKVKPIIRANHD